MDRGQGQPPAVEAAVTRGGLSRSAGGGDRGDEQRAGRRVRCPLLSVLSPTSPWSAWVWVTFWGHNRGHHAPSGCSSAFRPKMLDGRDSVPTALGGGLIPCPGFKCRLWGHAPSPHAQQVLGGATCPVWPGSGSPRGRPRAQEDLGPGKQPASPAAGRREWRPRTALRGRPFQNHSSGHSHLVTGQQVLGGLQVRAGLAHEDVPLAGGGPNGLRRGAAEDLPALTARQVEQGQLAWGGAGHHWAGAGSRPRLAAPSPPPLGP